MLDKNIGRRRFIQTLGVLAGMGVALTACGDTATSTVAAPTAGSGNSSTATSSSNPTAPAATTTQANNSPTTLPPVTAAATTNAATTSASTTTSTTTTNAATTPNTTGKSGQAPKGYDMLGAVSSYKASGDPVAFTVNTINGFVYNSNGDFYVFDDICTHQGCEVSYVPNDGKFECPCHGSQYDKTGEVVQGPARKRLKKYQTKVVNNTLYAKIS